MRIGIMTFWESQENYGQLLQVFALQSYLESLGHDAFVIKFRRKPPVIKKTLTDRITNFSLSHFIRDKKKKLGLIKPPVSRGFDAFRAHNLRLEGQVYDSFEALCASPPDADVYVCGSDQVWNNSFAVPCEPFLLGFGKPETKRIAYAASFGQSVLTDDTVAIFKKYLPNFTAVGVRENGGWRLCQDKLDCKSAVWVPDPTLLFDKNGWSKLLNLPKPETKSKQRIFLYTLANSAIQDRASYLNFVKSLPNTEIQHATANNDLGGNVTPSIPEWVNLIGSSDFVITNSFHGMVFCIIFNKNFAILLNTGKALGMNDRVSSLLEKVGLEDHAMVAFDENKISNLMHKKIDWLAINANIKSWASDARSFLTESLGSK